MELYTVALELLILRVPPSTAFSVACLLLLTALYKPFLSGQNLTLSYAFQGDT